MPKGAAMETQQFGEEKIRMPSTFSEICEVVKNFEVRDDDVFIAAFPKQGKYKIKFEFYF